MKTGGDEGRQDEQDGVSYHLQRFCSSSSFFFVFSILASSISSFDLLGFLVTGCSPSSFLTVWQRQTFKMWIDAAPLWPGPEPERPDRRLSVQPVQKEEDASGDEGLPFWVSSWILFSELLLHLLLLHWGVWFLSLSCRNVRGQSQSNKNGGAFQTLQFDENRTDGRTRMQLLPLSARLSHVSFSILSSSSQSSRPAARVSSNHWSHRETAAFISQTV